MAGIDQISSIIVKFFLHYRYWKMVDTDNEERKLFVSYFLSRCKISKLDCFSSIIFIDCHRRLRD